MINYSETELYNILKKQFYIDIDFDISKDFINETIESFFEFLNLDDRIKNHTDFKISETYSRGEIGFRHRIAEDRIYNDNKVFFHYHPDIFLKYSEFLKINPIFNNFMLKAKSIWELVYNKMKEILQIFEIRYPDAVDKVFNTNKPHIIIRFLKYEWQECSKYLAKPHFDSGSFTFDIAESGPGLRIGSRPENLKLVKHQENNAIFMLSSNFRKIIDCAELSAAWHDVVQVNNNKIGKFCSRWAIVAFIEAKDVEALSREETHKFSIY